MAYTTIKKPSDYFNTKLHNGTGVAKTLAYDFEVDMFWTKMRNQGYPHMIFDAVRGNLIRLRTAGTNAENVAGNTVSFGNSSGISLGSDSGNYGTNKQYLDDGVTTAQYVGWGWKANGAGSANTDGTISSTVSASTTSGFSIVSYTGTGANATVGHGLSVAPKMVIVKCRSTAYNWPVYHHKNGNGNVQYLNLNNASASGSGFWNSTTPTSSVFSVGTDNAVNQSGETYIAYCFAEKTGYSKFGSYTGNGSANGTFVYTGFKPAFVIMKSSSHAVNWKIEDSKRNQPFNDGYGASINANDNSSEDNNTAYDIDILSNGFKQRNTNSNMNNPGYSYIYMAFAEEPLVGDNPATAR